MAALSTRHRRAYAVDVRDDLLALMVRMTEEYPELPAGSVMRCVLAERLAPRVPTRVRRAG